MKGGSYMCRFIFFQFPQHHFLKRPSLLLFSNIGWLYLCDSIFAIFFFLFCWSFLSMIPFCLSYLNFHFALKQYCLSFWTFLDIVMTILGCLLCFQIQNQFLYIHKSHVLRIFYCVWTQFIRFTKGILADNIESA